MSSSTSKVTIESTPFAAFPHIVALSDGRVVEICCPYCNGNARARSPFPYFEGVDGMISHTSSIHKGTKLTGKEYLASPSLRCFSQEEMGAIEAGSWKHIIIKRVVAGKKGEAPRDIKEKENIPIPFYLIITTRSDGSYIQVECKFCRGNAQTRHSLDRKHVNKLAFFRGAKGLRSHIVQAHREQLKTLGLNDVDVKWVKENCGHMVDKDWVEDLMEDVAVSEIPMIKARSERVEAVEDGEVDATQLSWWCGRRMDSDECVWRVLSNSSCARRSR